MPFWGRLHSSQTPYARFQRPQAMCPCRYDGAIWGGAGFARGGSGGGAGQAGLHPLARCGLGRALGGAGCPPRRRAHGPGPARLILLQRLLCIHAIKARCMPTLDWQLTVLVEHQAGRPSPIAQLLAAAAVHLAGSSEASPGADCQTGNVRPKKHTRSSIRAALRFVMRCRSFMRMWRQLASHNVHVFWVYLYASRN